MAPDGGVRQEGGKINLSMLIDFLLQKSYHELTILSELLPRKQDIERKIEIVQFASRTQQQFVRLLALVKWAASAERVDKCQAISTFLDHQSMLFVDTADMLARMSRETLVQARLPTFCLPAAVDVLTMGSYPRLPSCIRDKIVPPDPISSVEKVKTLQRLNQVIQHRLVTSKLPPQLTNLEISGGQVKFQVEHEFEVTLTLMGDDTSIPWRLLSTEFLVQDLETGDGKPLVHSMQVHYIHQLVQSRLCTEENPLIDLYNCLHSFCLSLQLEVLHFQAKQLIGERWGDHVRIEEYVVGKKLVLSYWRKHPSEQLHQKQETHMLTVCADEKQGPAYLSVQHKPSLPLDPALHTQATTKVPAGVICVEKLLMQTIKAQSTVKLKVLWSILSEDKSVASRVTLDETTPSLSIQSSAEATPFEVIIITMETRNGQFRVSLGDKGDRSICVEMENNLQNDPKQFTTLLRDVRCQLHIRKCMRSLAQLPVEPSTYLPFVNANQKLLTSLGKNRLYIRFKRHPDFCLVVEVFCAEDSDSVTVKHHLLQIKPAFHENFEKLGPPSRRKSKQAEEKKTEKRKSQDTATTGHVSEAAAPARMPLFLAADHIVPLDAAVMTDYPGTPIKGLSCTGQDGVCGKRQQRAMEPGASKRLRTIESVLTNCHQNSSYEPQLGHIMASCDARIPFIPLIHQLSQQGVVHQGLESEASVGLALRILYLPAPPGSDPKLVSMLQQNLLDCVIRLDEKQEQWSLEMLFANCPVASSCETNKNDSKRVYFTYNRVHDAQRTGNDRVQSAGTDASVVQRMLDDWCSVCRVYQHVVELLAYLKDNLSHVRYMCRVHSYNYKQLTLQYPPDKPNLVTVEWSVDPSKFLLTFGHMSGNASNPHNLTSSHLQQEFNWHGNLAFLVKILNCTFNPLASLAKLNTKPMGGVIRRQLMMQNFSIVPQSSTCVLIIYRNSNAFEVQLRSNSIVAIRDASFSVVDGSYRKGGIYQYIPNSRSFLQNFVDDVARAGGTAPRNATTAEEDSVSSSSPVSMETEASLMNAQFMSPPPHASSQSLTASPGLSRSSAQPSGTSSVSMATTHSPFSSVNVNSPGSFYAPSPASFMQPSPASAHSPASSHSLAAQSPAPSHQFTTPPSNAAVSMTGASPALMPSPISWPMSPQVNTGGQATKYRPTTTQGSAGSNITPPRPLASRTWAHTMPTLISHAAFNKLCCATPVATARRLGGPMMLCPLEKFLGTMYLKRQLANKVINAEETLQSLKSDSSVEVFKVSAGLQCYIGVENPYTSLRLQVKPLQGHESTWTQEEMKCLERFFETRVAFAPYKPANLVTFARLLGAQLNILKDCIKIMKLELYSEPSLKWRVEWCLTMPLGFPAVAPAGQPSVVLKNKMLFFIQLTKPSSAGVIGDEQSIVIPVLYDTHHNSVLQADLPRALPIATRGTSPSSLNPTAVVSSFLKNWNERVPRTGECTIYPAVLELARNLVVPS